MTIADGGGVTFAQNATFDGALTATTLAGAWNVASIWRLHSALVFTNSGRVFLTANLEVSADAGAGILGASVTESSGVFTFPTTGMWRITFRPSIIASTGVGLATCQIAAPATTRTIGGVELPSSGDIGDMYTSFIYDVDDTGADTVKFRVNNQGSDDMTVRGSTTNNETYIMFDMS